MTRDMAWQLVGRWVECRTPRDRQPWPSPPGYNEWRQFCGLSRLETGLQAAGAGRQREHGQAGLALCGHPGQHRRVAGRPGGNFLPGADWSWCLVGKQMKALRDVTGRGTQQLPLGAQGWWCGGLLCGVGFHATGTGRLSGA